MEFFLPLGSHKKYTSYSKLQGQKRLRLTRITWIPCLMMGANMDSKRALFRASTREDVLNSKMFDLRNLHYD